MEGLHKKLDYACQSQHSNETEILSIYLKQISQYPAFSKNQEYEVAKTISELQEYLKTAIACYESGDSSVTSQDIARINSQLLKEKNALINANLRLVVLIARKMNFGNCSLLDKISEGNIGLIKAVDRFKHTKGFRFSTYGSWWIRQSILHCIQEKDPTIRIPVYILKSLRDCHSIHKQFTDNKGRAPMVDELANELGCSPRKVRLLLNIKQDHISLDSIVDEEGVYSFSDLVSDKNSVEPLEELYYNQITSLFKSLLQTLTDCERQVIELRYGIGEKGPLTLEETGELVGISCERVRQIQKATIQSLRSKVNRKGFAESFHA